MSSDCNSLLDEWRHQAMYFDETARRYRNILDKIVEILGGDIPIETLPECVIELRANSCKCDK